MTRYNAYKTGFTICRGSARGAALLAALRVAGVPLRFLLAVTR